MNLFLTFVENIKAIQYLIHGYYVFYLLYIDYIYIYIYITQII